MNQALVLSGHDPERANSIASRSIFTAMKAAALAVADSLGESDSAVNSNLMVPMRGEFFKATDASEQSENERRAQDIWQTTGDERRLVIVAETLGSDHRGFWVPLIQGEGSKWLPGAPEAWALQRGSAVYKDDLPRLSGFAQSLNARWQAFMLDRFRQRLFVSLPFRVSDGIGGWLVPCVLNVNVDTSDVGSWRRAMHAEWLEIARERARPFIEVAFNGLLLIFSDVTGRPILDTGSDDWNTLPVQRLALPKGETE
jgi:hypothetical protein